MTTIDNNLLRIFLGGATILALVTAATASAIGKGFFGFLEANSISLVASNSDVAGNRGNAIPITTMKNVALVDQFSENKNVEFSVVKDKDKPFRLLIEGKNKSLRSETTVKADRWLLWMQDQKTGEKTTDPRDVSASIGVKKIPPGRPMVIAAIDLEDHAYLFEERPSTYQLTLEASRVFEESSSEAQGAAIRGSGIGMETVYLVTAEIDVEYNTLAIKSSPNKILRMSNMGVEIGSSRPEYSIKTGDREPMQMTFYSINNADRPSSALRKADRIFLVNIDKPEASVTIGEISEQLVESCILLNPGEKKEMGRLDLGAGKFPLQNLMNKIAGEDEFGGTAMVEGTYILKVQRATADCSTPKGQSAAGGLHETVISFDVMSDIQ